jgi:hypothetical protein
VATEHGPARTHDELGRLFGDPVPGAGLTGPAQAVHEADVAPSVAAGTVGGPN